VGAFLADPILNRILTASKSEIHVRRIMDDGKILLVNLAKGRMGEDSFSLLGGLLVTTIGLAAYSRADIRKIGEKISLRTLLNFRALRQWL
jgi:hypothetical protein